MKMNREWKFDIFLFYISIVAIVTNAVEQNDKNSKIIVTEPKGNLTLPCHPEFQSVSDFEWVTDNDIPIYSNGRFSTFLLLDYLDSRFEVVNSSLVIREVVGGNVTFTCRHTRLNTTYSYFIHVRRSENLKYVSTNEHISFGKNGETVTLPCITDKTFQIPTSGASYTWLLTNNGQKNYQVISLNQRILLRNNSANFQVAEDRSLVIPNFIPNYRIEYECHLSTGQSISYYTSAFDEYKSSFADRDSKAVSLIEKTIAVGRGNDVTLNCSAAVSDLDFVWMRNDDEILSIGNGLIKNNKTADLKIDADGRLLTIVNFSWPLIGIYTCLTRTGKNYAYTVIEQKSFHQTIVTEQGKSILLLCSSSIDDNKPNFVWTRNKNEVLFINGFAVAGSKTDNLKIASDNRSLEIPEMSTALVGVYKCLLKTGVDYTYNVTLGTTKYKNYTLIVEYGSRNVVLTCPKVNKTENISNVWSYESRSQSRSPLAVNKEKFGSWLSEYYDVFDDSIVLKIVTYLQYGLYTCILSTGEQVDYLVTYETQWNNHTIWTNPGENITLPCPMKDPKDREMNIISWTFLLPKGDAVGEFRFMDGKMFPTVSFFKFPDNAKLADDHQTLIVSNITSDSEGDYICSLIRSNTIYRYTVKVKGT